MTDELNDIIEAETHARELYKIKVANVEKTYNDTCDKLTSDLQNVLSIKIGDKVKAAKGYVYQGRKAIVQEIGFLYINTYVRRYREAAARVVVLKKDGTESKVSYVLQLIHLEKI